ncbi:MAG: ABC transporter permease [Gammaproteobacteria bacterium]|nr:ABC transporter permease [Gammaproteobacteria bacterium]MDP2347518.1 ABC transporter permease [Gammaproteobacteria bacterium]
MFLSYLSTALHAMRKQPVFSAIKVLSLALGLAASILVVMHVQFVQTSNFHIDNWQNTYRMLTHMKMREINLPYRTASSSDSQATHLRADFGAQIPYLARIRYNGGVFTRNNESAQNTFVWAEPDAPVIFDFEFIEGDAASALVEPNTAIISEAAALKYFGRENPVGQVLTLDGAIDLRITGLIEDQPINATHRMEIVVSHATGVQRFGQEFMGGNSWLTFGGSETFMVLPPGTDPQWFRDNMPAFFDRHMPDDFTALAAALDFDLSLQPVTEMYLNPFDNFASPENTRDKTVLTGLILFSLLILASSCINYVNLSLSQITQRAKEIGVRKALGATRRDIVLQFLLESLLLTLVALLVALPIVYLAIPVYTNLTATEFVFSDMFQSSLAVALLGLILLTGLIAGIFPSLSLSKVEAALTLKRSIPRGRSSRLLRAGVTASQFTISTALILLAIATYVQINHLQEMDVGFDKENLVILDSRFSPQEPEAFNYNAMRDEILQHPGVRSIAAANFFPPGSSSLTQWRLTRGDPNATVSIVYGNVSAGFTETYGFELLAGRTFSEDFQADFLPPSGERQPGQTYGIVITDLTARRFGLDSPEAAIGELISAGAINYRVIGVIKRFMVSSGMESDQRSIGILIGMQTPQRALHIRVEPLQMQEALSHIDTVWERHRGGIPIRREIYSLSLNDMIVERNNGLSMASLIAAVITIIIAALGLYALASYATARRTKEVGVRKVLGASSTTIVMLLTWDFVRPVLVACLIAWPVAWYCVDLLYSTFSARAAFPITWYVGVTAGVAIMAFVTVASQCYRTANSDPVRSLRYE